MMKTFKEFVALVEGEVNATDVATYTATLPAGHDVISSKAGLKDEHYLQTKHKGVVSYHTLTKDTAGKVSARVV